MPVKARARRGARLQQGLAVAFAVFLAVAPFTRPSMTVHLAAVAAVASVEAVVVHDPGSAKASQPAAGLRPAQALTLGILSRLSSLEPPPALPPVKSSLMRPIAQEQPVGAIHASPLFGREVGQVFHRSSVGTARTPTGPPA